MAKTVWVSVPFEGAVQWSARVVAVKELQVGVGGQTQVHVSAKGIVHSGGGGVWQALERVIIKHVSGLIRIFVKIICHRVPVYIVCECVDCVWSRGVSSAAAARLFHWVSLMSRLAVRGIVIIFRVTETKGAAQPSIDLRKIVTPTAASSRITVRGGTRGFGHITAAAVLLHCQALWDEME